MITTGENCPIHERGLQVIPVAPVPKPRMTQRDRWKIRPPVVRYRQFCDLVRKHNAAIPSHGAHIIFVVPMPRSWSERKREQLNGAPHQQTPDVDNLVKALLDAVHEQDSGIWDIRATKVWGYDGKIIISDHSEVNSEFKGARNGN